jgi:hypothetical protein
VQVGCKPQVLRKFSATCYCCSSVGSLSACAARQMFRAMSKRPWLGPIFVMAAAMNATGMANAAGPISEDAYDHCRAISDDKARLRCFENLASQPPQTAPPPAQVAPSGSPKNSDLPQDSTHGSQIAPSSFPIAGKWRLVRTPNPREGRDVVSIMATAELSGSDLNFAGLDVRCVDQDYEILVFLIRPLRLRAQPAISMNGHTFQGSVVSPGTLILLPRAASVLAKEQWLSLPSLSVDIEDDGAKTHGLVSLDGFGTALQTLVATCSTR